MRLALQSLERSILPPLRTFTALPDAMAANPPQMRMLSLDEAKAAVTKAAARFEELENKETIKQTIDAGESRRAGRIAAMRRAHGDRCMHAAGGDTVKVMQTLPAVALGIVKDVVEEYGFEGSVPGTSARLPAQNVTQ